MGHYTTNIVHFHMIPLNGGPLDGTLRALATAPHEEQRRRPVLKVDPALRERTAGVPHAPDDRVEIYRLVRREASWRYVYEGCVPCDVTAE